MIAKTIAFRLLGAASLGLTAAGACVAARPEAVQPLPGRSHAAPGDEEPSPYGSRSGDAGAATELGGDAGEARPKCPYGALEDAHRGFVRCLNAGEADAGASPPATQPEAPDAGPEPSAQADAGPPAPLPTVELGTPDFENGDVPGVPKFLAKVSGEVAKCVADHGGLSKSSGTLKVQFLVRSRGRAEGVEVLSAKGVSEAAKACVRVALKNRAIGSPTADPVGVTVTFSLKPGAP